MGARLLQKDYRTIEGVSGRTRDDRAEFPLHGNRHVGLDKGNGLTVALLQGAEIDERNISIFVDNRVDGEAPAQHADGRKLLFVHRVP